jgi:hypothetical protein
MIGPQVASTPAANIGFSSASVSVANCLMNPICSEPERDAALMTIAERRVC